MKLNVGAIEAIGKGEDVKSPILQVIETQVFKSGGNTRCKVMLSDSVHQRQGILSNTLTRLVESGELKKFAIISLTDYVVNTLQGKSFLVLVDLKIIDNVPYQLGNPEEIDTTIVSNTGPTSVPPNSTSQRVYPPQAGATKPVAYANQMKDSKFTPIRGLNPYTSRWVLQCRVLSKSEIRSWDKGPNNQGKLFSVNLLDQDESEIRATFFRDAVDKYYDFLSIGKVYNFSQGQVKLANKKFNNTNCDYELTFGSGAEIVPVESSNSGIKTFSIKPTKISDLDPEKSGTADVCGAVINWGNIENFTSRAGKEITKLDVNLADDSNFSIRCTIFGEKCNEFERSVANLDTTTNPIIIGIRGARVSDFDGCSLGMMTSSQMVINPDVPEAQKILSWVRSGVNLQSLNSKSKGRTGGQGNDKGSGSVNSRVTCAHITSLDEIPNEKGEYFTVKGTVNFIRKDKMTYPACPEEGNNKKVVLQLDGSYYCEANGQSYKECEHRYISSMEIADHTGAFWVTCFNEQAADIIGYSANDLMQIKESNEEMYEAILLNATFEEYIFRIRVKNEMYNEERTKRSTLVSAERINYEVETKQLEEYIQQFSN